MADPRFHEAVAQFNAADWYACHDGFEALWHETQGPMRPVLQGILQIAVAHLHRERGNDHGAMVLMGEGLGRLQGLRMTRPWALPWNPSAAAPNCGCGFFRRESPSMASPPSARADRGGSRFPDKHSPGQPSQAQPSAGPR